VFSKKKPAQKAGLFSSVGERNVYGSMETWQLAILLKPLFLLILCFCLLYPIRKLTERYFPEGRVKRILLFRTDLIESYRWRKKPQSSSSPIATQSEIRHR
jgi:hypothetical protein